MTSEILSNHWSIALFIRSCSMVDLFLAGREHLFQVTQVANLWFINIFLIKSFKVFFLNGDSRIICQALQTFSSFKHFIKHIPSAVIAAMHVYSFL